MFFALLVGEDRMRCPSRSRAFCFCLRSYKCSCKRSELLSCLIWLTSTMATITMIGQNARSSFCVESMQRDGSFRGFVNPNRLASTRNSFPTKNASLSLSCSSGKTFRSTTRRSFADVRSKRHWEIHAMISLDLPTQEGLGLLQAYDDEYNGALIDPKSLPTSPLAFSLSLRASLSYWKSKGKRGIWLKILTDQSALVPIAIKEGFQYHHAEQGYVMLTQWISDEPCVLPENASHQVGVGGFVMNAKREVLVVQERQSNLMCSGIWKLPTGVIHKSEEIFNGAIREVKEETGIDTEFLEVIAFRHAHCVAFEKSDLYFICTLSPLSYQIKIDGIEIQEAKWMPLDEFLRQPFYEDDPMSKKILDMCIASFDNHYKGICTERLMSKFDGTSTFLYFNGYGGF